MNYFLIINGIFLLYLAVVLSNRGWVNAFIKMLVVSLVIGDLLLLLNQYGYIIKVK